MKKLIDKLILFIISLVIYISNTNQVYMIVPILIVIIFSSVLSYLENERITIAIFAIFIINSIFIPAFLFFIPVICYDVMHSKTKWLWVLAFLPLSINTTHAILSLRWLIAAIIIAAYALKFRTVSLQGIEKDYYILRDNAKEISIKLEKQNKELIEKQDYEINLATLKERNRIARDIHDNVGHLLSRSILQIGALLSINKNEETIESLGLIKATLSEAMDSIRSSVHDLHEESIDLHAELQKLVDGFRFCSIKFDYDVNTCLEKDIKYCFIAVTKEALSNIIKHSNATQALLIVHEHPALYQLIIHDNGTQSSYISENGIGIKNITDRVAAASGNINVTTEKGFRIFISIPKSNHFERIGKK